MEWHELVEQSKSQSEPFASTLKQAREANDKGASVDDQHKCVDKDTTHALDIERSYIIVSEKEMRRISGQARIKRGLLKSLNSLEVPAEDASGKLETVYCFADKQNPFRRATLRITSSSTLSSTVLGHGKALWAGQGEAWHHMSAKQQGSAIGTSQLVEKELQGHLNLIDWEDFLEEKLKAGKDDGDEEQDVDDAQPQDHDMKLVGKAASGIVVAPSGHDFLSPPVKAAKKIDNSVSNAFKRSSSASSVVCGSVAEDGASVLDSALSEDREAAGL
eukprot:6492445-Amphidinium_carterae.4